MRFFTRRRYFKTSSDFHWANGKAPRPKAGGGWVHTILVVAAATPFMLLAAGILASPFVLLAGYGLPGILLAVGIDVWLFAWADQLYERWFT